MLRNVAGRIPIKLVLLVLIAGVLVMGGMAVMKMKGSKAPKKAVVSEVKLEEFVVNLADVNEPHYLKVSITLEVEGDKPFGEAEGGHGGEASSPEDPKIRDTVIGILTKKNFEQLLTEKGKTELKDELRKGLSAILKDKDGSKVTEVYFTSFAMQ